MSLIDLYQQLFGRSNIANGTVIDMAEHGRVGGVSTGQPFKFVADIGGLGLIQYDYVSRSLAGDGVTETWTFKKGGASGTTTNTVVIVYTDSTLGTISTVTKT